MKQIIIDEESNLLATLGNNAKENTQLVKDTNLSNPSYIWFHLDGVPSPHLVVHSEHLEKKHIIQAATYVKNYSANRYRNLHKIKVNYIEVKFVKPTHTMGQVTLLKKPKTVTV